MHDLLDIRPEVAEALSAGHPVVALESTLIAHGLPYPRNLETARRVESVVREAGAVPATVGVAGGRLCVGLKAQEIERFARGGDTAKASGRDLAAAIVGGGNGATTVAATLVAAHLAGIRVFATGGIGGVHRGRGSRLDVSADLAELAHRPVALVSAGAKAILDLAGTLEVLETQGVPVIGYGTNEFPAFYCRESGHVLEARVDTPFEAARLMQAHWTLGLGGLLIANPPPEAAALDPVEVEALVGRALDDAQSAGVGGKRLTPFLLDRVNELSDGRTLEANVALIEANAALGAELAAAIPALGLC
ncbi:MAG: pseudouridine-5'-phosphate glycosidase [Rhodospirillales bacterium]|nr:pseudouridine-5'-phosphate glycosidase [Rhodospirillales bacterium]MDH3791132.1 pseudouridine-5'-phosphate glycosidase [Rhodospirillales bacterium]MDH3912440.1 pseudouridine-5'-phosphate glycosidase [Rhodospirillales bacterium]MDH3918403.1 pseudouridine-5'-phosphate glycosidase [Rhodospirillales bacterium]MDH3967690.1 pseudouridine-5'-phosphate glycosidase [Rhodospirillales bacterium]